MKRILLILLATLVIAAPLGAVTFGTSAVASGTSWTESSHYGSSVDLVLDNGMGVGNPHNVTLTAQQAHQERSVSRTKKITVTAVQGNKISGFQVQYTSVNVNGTDETSTFAGKTYAISITGNHVGNVTFGDGSVVPAEELAFVQPDNSNIAQVRAMADALGGETVAVGDSLSAKNLDDLFDVQSGFTVDSYSMTLTSVDAGTATFDVSLHVSSEVKKGKGSNPNDPPPFSTSSMHLTLAGQMHADVASGRVLDFSFTGPVTAGGQKEAHGRDNNGNDIGAGTKNGQPRTMSLSATGTATLGANFSY